MSRNRKPTRRLLLLTVVLHQTGWSAQPIDVGFELASNLPPTFSEYLQSARGLDSYVLDAWINTYYLQGDFNGDNMTDIAIFVREDVSGKAGLLIHHGGTDESHVLAAGSAFEDRGDDFSRFNGWYVHPHGPVSSSAHAQSAPPSLLGDAVHLAVLESASGIVYWTGDRYAWYQQGD